jgi:hypothetical protein
VLRRDAADTLFLLSDGLPTAGLVTGSERIIRRLGMQNIVNRMEIHTIYTGSEEGKGLELMKEIARWNQGQSIWPGKR